MCSADIFLGLLAILFPPLPVWVKTGLCSADSVINILLCILGYIPGLLHSWYIIANYPEPDYEYRRLDNDPERVTYVFVAPAGGQHHGGDAAGYPRQARPNANKPANGGNNNRTYGTTANGAGSSAPSSAPAPQQQNPQQQQQQQGPSDGGEGPSDGPPPPSYAQVVAGDNKVQTHD